MRGGAVLAAAALTAFSTAAWAVDDDAHTCAIRARDGDVSACQRAVANNPDDPAMGRHLATALMALGDYDAAVDAYRANAARRPESARAQYEFAAMLGFVRRYAEAVAPIEAALRHEPDNLVALKLAAMVFHQTDREPDSFRATSRAAQLGDSGAMFDMIWHYENGRGVAADPRAALTWAGRAAEAGHVAAMDLMVEIYLVGLYGEAPDDTKAESWAMRARNAREAE